MIEVANEWLQKYGTEWEVVNCETVIFLYKYNDSLNSYELRPNDCCFYIYGSEKNNVLKALRIWIRRRNCAPGSKHDPLDGIDSRQEQAITSRECDSPSPQVLKVKDFRPEYKKNGDGFEDLDDLIGRFNENARTTGLDGRIITIESIGYEATKDWSIDTQTSLSTFSTKNVFILRIFYQLGELTRECIGIEDFAPKLISRATFFKRPAFETFDKVIERASAWMRKQTRCRFINAQSIDIKMKSVSLVNSRQMAFTEHGDYMRIFRITYIELPDPVLKPVILSTRLFLPYNKTDTMFDIKRRLSDWVNQYLERYRSQAKKSGQSDLVYPRILSAETVEVFAKDFRNDNPKDMEKAANNDTLHFNRFGNKYAYMFFSLRIFYDTYQLATDSSITIDSVHSTPTITKKTNFQSS